MRRRMLSVHRLVTALDQLDRMIAWADDVEEGVNAKEAGVLDQGMPLSEIGLSESDNPCTPLARAEVKRSVKCCSCCTFWHVVRAAPFLLLTNVEMRTCFSHSFLLGLTQFTPVSKFRGRSRNIFDDRCAMGLSEFCVGQTRHSLCSAPFGIDSLLPRSIPPRPHGKLQ